MAQGGRQLAIEEFEEIEQAESSDRTDAKLFEILRAEKFRFFLSKNSPAEFPLKNYLRTTPRVVGAPKHREASYPLYPLRAAVVRMGPHIPLAGFNPCGRF
jgi:hypothetical protein